MSFQLPYFGTIDTKTLEEYYDVDIELGGYKLSLDLNFDEESISTDKLEKIRLRLENLPALFEEARTAVRQNFTEGGDALEYITHHLDLLTAPALQDALRVVDGNLSAEERLFALVHPVRIGLYPEDEEHYFTLDFSIGKALTDYLIVVVMNVDEDLQYITMES